MLAFVALAAEIFWGLDVYFHTLVTVILLQLKKQKNKKTI